MKSQFFSLVSKIQTVPNHKDRCPHKIFESLLERFYKIDCQIVVEPATQHVDVVAKYSNRVIMIAIQIFFLPIFNGVDLETLYNSLPHTSLMINALLALHTLVFFLGYGLMV